MIELADPPARHFTLDGINPRSALPGGMGGADPCARSFPGGFARAVHTPVGAGTVLFRWTADGAVTVQAWGGDDAVDWLLSAAPAWLGLHDDVDSFRPAAHPLVAELWRRLPGQRLGASGLVWPELVPSILSQRVMSVDARGNWIRLVRAWGSAAPGPASLGLRLPPAPEQLRALTYVDLHRFDVERRRADAVLLAARHAARLEEAATMSVSQALVRLQALNGLGAWTATTVVAATLADPDTVVLRDFWMPTIVQYAFTGDRRRCEDDGRMLELLEPFAGHRWRVVCLLGAAGIHPPRRAPRKRLQRIAKM